MDLGRLLLEDERSGDQFSIIQELTDPNERKDEPLRQQVGGDSFLWSGKGVGRQRFSNIRSFTRKTHPS